MPKYEGMTYRAATRYEHWEVEADNIEDAKNAILRGDAELTGVEHCADMVNVGFDYMQEVEDEK